MIEKKEKKIMAKKEEDKAKFTKTVIDAKTPAKTPWGASLRNVLPLTLDKGQQVTLKFGLACDKAVVVWPHRNLDGLASGTQIFMPGEEISVSLWNKGDVRRIPESTMCLHLAFFVGFDFDVI